ncbi:molybdopterin oxidoreductase family protein [Pendulispora albinea]|uniref:Molybdopterin oxidoreductase family protein n=2 Tax=Pendulispora albinea TaxID=2741071 RepID=A0ABZ2LU78_9BACT
MRIAGSPAEPSISGDPDFPVNRGSLCIKGWSSGATLAHPERLTTPLVRNLRGFLDPASWDEALDRTVAGFRAAQARGGCDAVGLFGSGALTNEKAYLLGKFARIALGTRMIDYNGRFCMSSAAAASNRAFGVDRGLPFPLSDIAHADVVLLVGSNVAETMPPIVQYFEAQRARGGKLIVVDPRRSVTALAADLHLRLAPGTDAALAHGLLHLLVRDGAIDTKYIRERTEGFDHVRAAVARYWPERTESLCGVPEAELVLAARLLGHADTVMVLTGRGPEQQSHGVDHATAYIHLALALGMVGKPHAGYGCLTGQGNGQGGREHGQKADQLPGYRRIDDPAAREHVARVWGVDPGSIPGAGESAYEMLDSIGEADGIRALWVVGSNPAVSAPNARRIEARLRELDFLAVSDFFRSETAEMADVVFPAAQWAEESGTTTNLEGRVILRRRAFSPPPEVRTDLTILCDLAARLGKGELFASSDPEHVFDELCRASAGGVADYSAMSYGAIEAQGGLFWPSPRLFAERFPTPTGRARFHPVRDVHPAEEPNESYPLYLTTGRVLAQYQSGTQTRRVPALTKLAHEPLAELHPAVARRHGIADGDVITLTTRRGRAQFAAKVTASIREDTVFVPFHWGGERSANRLTNDALDPTSRMPEFKVCAVRIERTVARDANAANPAKGPGV